MKHTRSHPIKTNSIKNRFVKTVICAGLSGILLITGFDFNPILNSGRDVTHEAYAATNG